MLNNLVAPGIFYILAAIIVVFAAMTVTLKNTFHCALSLVMVLLAVAGIYIYLDAEFIAIVQILIFVGAIMTLIIFAIMLTVKITDKSLKQHNELGPMAFLVSGGLAAFLVFILLLFHGQRDTAAISSPSLADIAHELLYKYALPFEVISVILLAALVGALVISSNPQR